ncbi:MAG: hypothetical protein P1V51_15535 [Deltaproteobacteria bacterium]|nr:hypothetical protein [Deltaproteobacteria bacterium]
MSDPTEADLGALIEALLDAEVRFAVVGGAAAILHGAPTSTLDLDILVERSKENAERLARVAEELEATIRDATERRLRPTRALFETVRQLLLSTRLGPLDVLGELHDGRGLSEVMEATVVLEDGERRIRVIDLPTLLEIKSSTGRTKDRLVVPLLLALLEERET